MNYQNGNALFKIHDYYTVTLKIMTIISTIIDID